MPVMQVCLGCQRLTANGSRCPSCATRRESARYGRRVHYHGDYRQRAARVRAAANADPLTKCWLCGEPARPDDPWTADHVEPNNVDSPLQPAHRSCNSSRGDRDAAVWRRRRRANDTNTPPYVN